MTRKINFLINNDIKSKSKKNLLAKEFGIEIISEQDFLNKFDLDEKNLFERRIFS